MLVVMLFDLSNVEWGPRSSFWDHSKHFWTNGFRVIAPNIANFRVKCYFWDDIFTLSCPHLKILTFDLSNVERGPRSSFWDHLQHFRTNGFRVIAQNTANFKVKWLFRANFWVKYGCHAPIWKLKEIFISSLWHLKEIYISFWNNTNTSFSTFLCGLKAARF